MNVDPSAKTLNIQTNIKVVECNELIYQEAMYNHKKWSQLPTSSFLVSVAEGILQGIMNRVNQYHACLVSKSKCNTVFQVSYMGGDQVHKLSESPEQYSRDESIESTTLTSPIPRFSHIRIVTMDSSVGQCFALVSIKPFNLEGVDFNVDSRCKVILDLLKSELLLENIK